MEAPEQAKFEGWAIVEMMGHQREIGFVTTEAFGQAVMFRIDTPELPEREFELTRPEWVEGQVEMCGVGTKVKRQSSPARSRLVAPGALYAINPCTEQAAREALERSVHRPLMVIEFKPNTKAIQSPREDQDDSDRCEDCNHPLELCECPI